MGAQTNPGIRRARAVPADVRVQIIRWMTLRCIGEEGGYGTMGRTRRSSTAMSAQREIAPTARGAKDGVSRGEFCELLVAGQGCGEAEEGEEMAALAFVSDGEPAVAEQPGDRPLDLPAVAAEPFAALGSRTRDPRDQGAAAETGQCPESEIRWQWAATLSRISSAVSSRGDPQPTRHLHDRVALRALQHDPRPLSQCLCRRTTTHPPLQHRPLGISQW